MYFFSVAWELQATAPQCVQALCGKKMLCDGLQGDFDRKVASVIKKEEVMHSLCLFPQQRTGDSTATLQDITKSQTCINTVEITFPFLLRKPSSIAVFMFDTPCK